jgi:16S rRNA processing protein RimM
MFLDGFTMSAPVLSPPSLTADSLVTIGRILKPFGVRGEVKVESLSDVPGRFEGLQTMYLTLPHEGATPQKTAVTHVRKVAAGYLMKCSAFSTPEEATHFRGAWIQIPQCSELPRAPDTFYHFELIGLRVEDPSGQEMGTVEEILEYPQHHVLVVRNQEAEFLIPANRGTIEKVDLDNQTLHVASKESWNISHAL